MAIHSEAGHVLNIGDKVKMNIAVIEKEDMDGIELTTNGRNYWRYMKEHPDEVYTVTGFDFSGDETGYELDGYMADNNWYANELIHVPEPASQFEVIKNMTLDEAPGILLAMIRATCEDSLPTEDVLKQWLQSKPAPIL